MCLDYENAHTDQFLVSGPATLFNPTAFSMEKADMAIVTQHDSFLYEYDVDPRWGEKDCVRVIQTLSYKKTPLVLSSFIMRSVITDDGAVYSPTEEPTTPEQTKIQEYTESTLFDLQGQWLDWLEDCE